MKDFTEQLNDMIAPVTRAWSEPEILKAEVRPEGFQEDALVVTLLVKVRRKSTIGMPAGGDRDRV